MEIKYDERGNLVIPRDFSKAQPLLKAVKEGRVARKKPQEPFDAKDKSFAEVRRHARRQLGISPERDGIPPKGDRKQKPQAVTQQQKPIQILKDLGNGRSLAFCRLQCGGSCGLMVVSKAKEG